MHNSQVRADETPEQREVRLSALQTHNSPVRADETPDRCYPNQVTNHKINLSTASYLPAELTSKGTILLCHRCKKHLTSKKTSGPVKAYWNNLDPGEVPDAIKQLTQPEQRLLSGIIPFVKIVKYDGLLGQYGFRGQAVLFA
ncbi:ATP-dependent DNA helicase [Trichonephila clavata]|uniref:ATP-dependent DNA helicase n=1 Tax=Trichonephila clavata TaxID=2740835 RepID=A0A8X6KMS6_TRICU|nr:ATP-dependent DNA helicase [Trichonephila clavata]